MSDISFSVKMDTAELSEMLKSGEIERRAEPIVKAAAFTIEGKAKQNAPVDTGFLKNSIQAEPGRGANWIVQDGADYGIHQELGTRYIAPKFFLTQAVEATAEQFFDALVKVFK